MTDDRPTDVTDNTILAIRTAFDHDASTYGKRCMFIPASEPQALAALK